VVSLKPLSGRPRELDAALRAWVTTGSTKPIVVRTSGSSGDPKEVVLSSGATIASADATLARIGGPGQWLLALPPQYVAGAQVLVRSALAGIEVIFVDEYADFATAVRQMATDVRRYTALVPTQMHRLLETDAEALAALDVVLLGGAAADPGLLARACDAGVTVVVTYGMSETCGGCVYDGVPLDGVGVRIAGDGRIHVLGPVLFDGYRGRPDQTAEVMVDGALRTPDLGRIDDDGRLEVLGRADGLVVSGGVNVPLSAVERRLREHSDVTEAVVLGVAHAEWGTQVVAVVATPSPGLDELRDFVEEMLPREWAPRELVELAELPLLASGKVDRVAVRAAVEDVL
jgi:o-succinylbenzoate---CoA ligase